MATAEVMNQSKTLQVYGKGKVMTPHHTSRILRKKAVVE